MDIPSGGLKGAEAQLVILDAHVTQLLQLRLPLALWKDKEGKGVIWAPNGTVRLRGCFQDRKKRRDPQRNY